MGLCLGGFWVMHCCIPWLSLNNIKTPLLQGDQQEDDSLESLLKRLERRVRTQTLQAEQYRNDQIENRLRAENCAKKGDKIGARHYLEEARKSAHYYDAELKQKSNVQEVHRKLREAIVNAETVKNISATNMTLAQLQKEMPTERIEEIMDALQDHAITTNQQSEILAGPGVYEDVDDLNAEVETLMELTLPNVPKEDPKQEQNLKQEHNSKKTQLLKSE